MTLSNLVTQIITLDNQQPKRNLYICYATRKSPPPLPLPKRTAKLVESPI